MHAKRVLRLGCVIVTALLAGLPAGCGTKGPPVPPRSHRPPAITDLSYRLQDGALSLAWTIPAAGDRKAAAPVGCTVYEAREPLANTVCPECSQPFKPVADLPVQPDAPGPGLRRAMTYAGVLTQGFIYTYKVVCYTRDGGLGVDSNYVNLEY